ncbi:MULTISPECIES: ATP-binding cassette domain-containing protein [unclassified Paenibacillus]|uniref:ATP-binding cassette domain-containing protein n=1 Tax=unclassified Paenibacillus TaxID=185978 RepID=UPI00070BA6D7|nr:MULTISPECIES: ATP-binding cassette domain-containing protein [unclassified Paenibacillus]KQX46931.1 hypothetical protein ASD40_16790 [Paenibacillus sp. Root444D2]KRE48441.1 hypothetical protein ASG85_05410 [Paenibacillus sp. Soil724D2]
MAVIEVKQIAREFKVRSGTRCSFRLFKTLLGRNFGVKRVVDNISFTIEEGDFVGYIGPNGAGKSTTIKMLSGVLTPTSGTVQVLGLEPFKNRKQNAKAIGVVFGQRTQLWWDLPFLDSFRLLGSVYKVEPERLRNNITTFTELLDWGIFSIRPSASSALGNACAEI